MFWALISSRMLHMMIHYPAYAMAPRRILQLTDGGMSFFGAAAGAGIFLFCYCRRHQLPPAQFADLCAPGLALAYAFARVGCFLAGCCHGWACNLWWAVRFHIHGSPNDLTPPSHPTQLYAAVASFLFFLVLDRYSRVPHPAGSVLLRYITYYCSYRFVIEFFLVGGPADVFAWGLKGTQVFCLALFTIALVLDWRLSANVQSNKLHRASQLNHRLVGKWSARQTGPERKKDV